MAFSPCFSENKPLRRSASFPDDVQVSPIVCSFCAPFRFTVSFFFHALPWLTCFFTFPFHTHLSSMSRAFCVVCGGAVDWGLLLFGMVVAELFSPSRRFAVNTTICHVCCLALGFSFVSFASQSLPLSFLLLAQPCLRRSLPTPRHLLASRCCERVSEDSFAQPREPMEHRAKRESTIDCGTVVVFFVFRVYAGFTGSSFFFGCCFPVTVARWLSLTHSLSLCVFHVCVCSTCVGMFSFFDDDDDDVVLGAC